MQDLSRVYVICVSIAARVSPIQKFKVCCIVLCHLGYCCAVTLTGQQALNNAPNLSRLGVRYVIYVLIFPSLFGYKMIYD